MAPSGDLPSVTRTGRSHCPHPVPRENPFLRPVPRHAQYGITGLGRRALHQMAVTPRSDGQEGCGGDR